jgi:hypothetical protein
MGPLANTKKMDQRGENDFNVGLLYMDLITLLRSHNTNSSGGRMG